MHNKVSCLPPRLLHRVHCRRTSLHFAAPSRVVVLVPVARRNPAHQSRVVVVPPVLHRVWSLSVGRRHHPARPSGVVICSSVACGRHPAAHWASSFRQFFRRRHPVRQSRVVVIQPPVERRRSARPLGVVVPPVRWASSFRPSVGRRRPAVLGLLVRFVVLMLSCSSMLSVAHLLFAVLWNCSEGARGRRKSKVNKIKR